MCRVPYSRPPGQRSNASSTAFSSPRRRTVWFSVPRPGSMPTPPRPCGHACAGGCCACSCAGACYRAMTRRRRRNGNTAAASPSLARCASRPLTAPGASGCCAIVPARRSAWTGCASSIDPEHLLYESTKQGPGGNRPLLLTPLQPLDRLATLVPPPDVHRHRCIGMLVRTAAHRKFPLRPGTAGAGRETTVGSGGRNPEICACSSGFSAISGAADGPRACAGSRRRVERGSTCRHFDRGKWCTQAVRSHMRTGCEQALGRAVPSGHSPTRAQSGRPPASAPVAE
jgi:hypothetical protein